VTAGSGQPGTEAQDGGADAPVDPAVDPTAAAQGGAGAGTDTESEAGMTADEAIDVEVEDSALGDPSDADAPNDEVAALTEDLKRVSAEYANYRRRVQREQQSAVAGAKASVLSGLLEIADELGMAAQHGDLTEGSALSKFNDKFFAVLGSQGVEEFGEEGDEFDPSIHEAVQDLSSGGEPKIATVYRKGYRVGDKVLRNAMVVVGS